MFKSSNKEFSAGTKGGFREAIMSIFPTSKKCRVSAKRIEELQRNKEETNGNFRTEIYKWNFKTS